MTFELQKRHNVVSERAIQGALLILLMFGAGSSFSLGVFIPFVEAGAHPRNSLDGIWETAMGAMHFLSAPAMILASLFLDKGHVHHLGSVFPPPLQSKTHRSRLLCFLSLLSYTCLCLSAFGAAYSYPLLVFCGVAIQALPLAIVYFLCIQLAIAWFPNHAGLVVGIAETCFSAGTIVLSYVFSKFITALNYITAIYLSSCVLVATAVLPSLYMRWPSVGEIPQSEEKMPLMESSPESPPEIEKIEWHQLLKLSNFWYFVVAVFSTGATYVFNPYFFRLGEMFHMPFDSLVLAFTLSNIVSTVFGLFGTALTDYVGFGTGFWYSGAKNVSLVLMLMQCVALVAMTVTSNLEIFWAFVVIKTFVKIVGVCHTGNSAILARDMFGPENGSIVFGIGAGLALGSGEGVSAWLMAALEALRGRAVVAADYNMFYWVAMVWSAIGALCLAATTRQYSTRAV